jgi:hypothetical protein
MTFHFLFGFLLFNWQRSGKLRKLLVIFSWKSTRGWLLLVLITLKENHQYFPIKYILKIEIVTWKVHWYFLNFFVCFFFITFSSSKQHFLFSIVYLMATNKHMWMPCWQVDHVNGVWQWQQRWLTCFLLGPIATFHSFKHSNWAMSC